MEKQNGETGQRNPKRLTKTAAGTLAGLCLGFGMYGMIHGLRAEESTFRLILSSITLCCGILLLLRTRGDRKTEEKEN